MSQNKHLPVDVAPVLIVSDLRTSIAWYAKLGFQADAIHGTPPAFAMANHEMSTIMLRQSDNGSCRNHSSVEDMWDIYIWIQSAAETLKHLKAEDIEILRGPTETAYNCTEIEVMDPDGHIICFGACP